MGALKNLQVEWEELQQEQARLNKQLDELEKCEDLEVQLREVELTREGLKAVQDRMAEIANAM